MWNCENPALCYGSTVIYSVLFTKFMLTVWKFGQRAPGRALYMVPVVQAAICSFSSRVFLRALLSAFPDVWMGALHTVLFCCCRYWLDSGYATRKASFRAHGEETAEHLREIKVGKRPATGTGARSESADYCSWMMWTMMSMVSPVVVGLTCAALALQHTRKSFFIPSPAGRTATHRWAASPMVMSLAESDHYERHCFWRP